MGRITVKPGDVVSIKHPERNSLVKAGKIQLKAPDSAFAVVPKTIAKSDLALLNSLVEWDIITVNSSPVPVLTAVEQALQ
jgi:hypothetical protein